MYIEKLEIAGDDEAGDTHADAHPDAQVEASAAGDGQPGSERRTADPGPKPNGEDVDPSANGDPTATAEAKRRSTRTTIVTRP